MTAPLLSLLLPLLAGCAVVQDWPGEDDRPGVPGASQAGMLSGVVRDEAGVAISGAHVTTSPGGVEATTDASGAWSIARVVPGEYTVVVAADGYVPVTSDVLSLTDGDGEYVEATLTPEPVADGYVRVRTDGPQGPTAGWIVTAVSGADTISTTTDAAGDATLEGLGGATWDITVADPDGRLWSSTFAAVDVPALGGVDLATRLTGRAAEGAAYSGSTVCSYCHADQAAAWQTTPHSRAMSDVEGEPAEAFAADTELDLGGPSALLTTIDGAATVILTDTTGATDTWTVSGFIGGSDRGAVPWAERDGVAWPLPVAWLAPELEHEDWQTRGWTVGSTAAFFDSAGAFAYTNAPDVATSAEQACFGCHTTGWLLADGSPVQMTAATDGNGRWEEAAVGCEACHGPGQEHTSGRLDIKLLTITNPGDLDAARANDVCEQCHAARSGAFDTPYAWSEVDGAFHPGQSLADSSTFVGWSDGAAREGHAQADEMARSAHQTNGWTARCVDCHDPHGSDYQAQLRLDEEDNTLCLSCHAGLTFGDDDAAVESHVAHVYSPDSFTESGRCTGCHMPPTAVDVAWDDLTAAGTLSSHRFVPVPPSSSLAAFDAASADQLDPGSFEPNACQECHAWNEWLFEGGFPGPAGDMTLRATHEALQTAYEEKYP